MKIALCFIINYEHKLNKELIWREWIEYNKDIINVYFYYKDFSLIHSSWIKEHAIPSNYIHETSYYHVIPAYISLLKFALFNDTNNLWFCMLTDSCCPIISPKKFRYLFFQNCNKSIISWKKPWWNIHFHTRANLNKLPSELHLANDPWFILKRENVFQVLTFVRDKQYITNLICKGGLANESLFAIILFCYGQLDSVLSETTHIADWVRMSSPTSPHIFKDADENDISFLDNEIVKHKYTIFIRKIAPQFPDNILRYYIYEKNKLEDDNLASNEFWIIIYDRLSRFWNIYLLMAIIYLFIYYFSFPENLYGFLSFILS